MTLQEQIRTDLTAAMKQKEEPRLTVLRGLVAAFTNELVQMKRGPQGTLSDEEALSIIRRGVKQRKDAIQQFIAGNRPELAANEEAEIRVLASYLPQLMNQDEIRIIAEAKKTELGVTDKSKAGILMSALMKDLKGKADGNDVKAIIDILLK